MKGARIGSLLALGAVLAACGPQVVVQSHGGDASGASASNSATGGSSSNEGSLSAGASGGNAQAGAGAAAGASVEQSSTSLNGSVGASAAPGAPAGGGGAVAASPTPTPVPTPTPSIAPTQLIWHDDFELASAGQVPGWTGFIGSSALSWRGLRAAPGEGQVSLVLSDANGQLPTGSSGQSANLRREVDLRGVARPRLRLLTTAGGLRPDLVRLSVALGTQVVVLPVGQAWAEQDVDLSAWAGNQGPLVLEGQATQGTASGLAGPAVDDLRLYDAGK